MILNNVNSIISYAEQYKDKTFDVFPFTEVDSLILCQLSYLSYDRFVGDVKSASSAVLLEDIYNSENYEDLFKDYWYKEENKKLLKNIVSSDRYKGMKLNFFDKVINEDNDTQFAAVTFILNDKSIYLAFRGTDATLVGWKEDMKLAYSHPIRSQELAREYVDKVSSMIAGPFKVGGHSKGGNLAVYAAMYCKAATRKRIEDVFDHDGPGFRPEIRKKGKYEEIRSRIHKFIPRFSTVGIILEDSDDYEVVDCWGVGTLQHNSYMWKSEGGRFIRSKGMTDYKKLKDISLNEWIYSLTEDEVGIFIDTLYELLTAADGKTLYDLAANPKKSLESAYITFKDMDQKTKDILSNIMKKYLEISSDLIIEGFKAKKEALKEEVRNWQKSSRALIRTNKK